MSSPIAMKRHSLSAANFHTIARLLALILASGLLVKPCEPLTNSHWLLPSYAAPAPTLDSNSPLFNRELERESAASSPILFSSQQHPIRSPVSIGQQAQVSNLFKNNGRLPTSSIDLNKLREIDLFHCVEPTRTLYESFVRQYNRTFVDAADKLERLNLFWITLKRAIMLNRLIQNEILNSTNYQLKTEIRNYHFVEPTNGQNAAIWYADITDCELGLIKKIMFDIFYLIDINDYASAYKIVQENKEYLPTLLTDDGFEQLADILLIRLNDRFRGDEKMHQLFQWPIYLKKLASFAYSQQQSSQPGFKTKLALISFAYPAYFKDLKYNLAAINRTGDNYKASDEHKRFNQVFERKFANLNERNKRLAIFRQRWTLLDELNNDRQTTARNESASSARHASQLPDWLRVQYLEPSELPAREQNFPRSDKLIARDEDATFADFNKREVKAYRMTRFSDLTDVEFVAFLSNDFSLLENNKESASFLERNFPVQALDKQLRWDIAAELELRRATTMSNNDLLQPLNGDTSSSSVQLNNNNRAQQPVVRASLRLAKQIVDELISDVGLPIGPATVENINETEHYTVFEQLGKSFKKSYFFRAASSSASIDGQRLTDSDIADERQHRYTLFKQNYGRFQAWWIKEGWTLDDEQRVAMLRLADMSWLEIKLTLFRVCCLTSENLNSLSSFNATINYLGSNNGLMCEQLGSSAGDSGNSAANWYNTNEIKMIPAGDLLEQQQQQQQQSEKLKAAAAAKQQQQQQQQQQSSQQDTNALELYYYYCVHFNKHHLNGADFERRLEIFRRNVDAIRHHSCKRSLTLYESFRLKRPDILSTIDVIDSRRSHTDDLNLDRFEYFNLVQASRSEALDLIAVPPQAAPSSSGRKPGQSGNLDASRASFSYKREFFSNLLTRPGSSQEFVSEHHQRGQRPQASYSDKLVDIWQDVDEYARRYKQNSVGRVYDLVVSRYKLCMKTLAGVDLESKDLRQQCQASGPLADQAGQLSATGAIWTSLDQLDSEGSGGGGQYGRLRAQAQQQDQCAFYRQGLEPWSEGLTRQDPRTGESIRNAKC